MGYERVRGPYVCQGLGDCLPHHLPRHKTACRTTFSCLLSVAFREARPHAAAASPPPTKLLLLLLLLNSSSSSSSSSCLRHLLADHVAAGSVLCEPGGCSDFSWLSLASSNPPARPATPSRSAVSQSLPSAFSSRLEACLPAKIQPSSFTLHFAACSLHSCAPHVTHATGACVYRIHLYVSIRAVVLIHSILARVHVTYHRTTRA